MAEQHRSRLVRKRRVRSYSGRGGIYAWLRIHYAQVIALRDGERRPWSDLIAEMNAHGVLDQAGSPPTLKKVSRAWGRVVRDVHTDASARQAAASRVGSVPPSRVSPQWRPQEATPPAHSYPPPHYPLPSPPLPASQMAGVPAAVPYPSGPALPVAPKRELTPEQREHVAREIAKTKAGFAELDKKFLFPS